MFNWIIPDRLGKAGKDDVVPDGAYSIIVAAEYPNAVARLKDENIPQHGAMAQAVAQTMYYLIVNQNMPNVVVCQQGRSRSVTVACLVAALYQGRQFWDVWAELKTQDNNILDYSPLMSLAMELFPYQFEKEK